VTGSKTVLTSHFIQKFLAQRAEKIKELNFNATLIDGNALQSIAEIQNLQLENLYLRQCEQLTNEGIISLIDAQQNLQILNLTSTVRLTDLALMHICERLKNLKQLKVRKCRALTDISVKMIADLKHLQVLDISECENLTSACINDGIAANQNEELRELYLSALNISSAAISKISINIPNLRVLDLSYCINNVDDMCIQMILKHLVLLHELNLNLCERISDAGLTGISMESNLNIYEDELTKESENQVKGEPIVSGNILQVDPLRQQNTVKISLKSKAEREIVEDAIRKKAMLQLAKEINLQEQKSSNYSLGRLRGLQSLKLEGCNKVSDVSLIYNFKLPELKEINLSKCQQVSLQGIKELVENCPALEIVSLSECHNINDKCIELITTKLKRLTTLDISRCYQLTDFSLDSIAVNCKRIRNLFINGCKHMSDEPHLKLVSVETMRNISMAKPSEVENPSRIPRAPMLPSRI
jgi:F-box and leucine-rich repeat protein 9